MPTTPANINVDLYDRDTLAYVKPVTVSQHTGNMLFKFNSEFTKQISFQQERLQMIKSRMDKIRQLQFDWDGYGGLPVRQRVIINTYNFLNILPNERVLALEPENIVPTPYGTIELDWEKNERLLSIEIGLSKIGFFSKFPDHSNPFSDGFLFNGTKISLDLVQAFDQFFAE